MLGKKKVLITGGSGTVGRAFIKRYLSEFRFYSYSRNEKMQFSLKRDFKDVETIIGSVEDRSTFFRAVHEIRPDIIIHAAAIKHIQTGEKDPIQTSKVNILGSLNVLEAAEEYKVSKVIGISTDKACQPKGNYGYSKRYMEKMFLQASSPESKFAACRFGNVTHSSGSVLPFWLNLVKQSKSILLTHPECNRFMFSRLSAAELIRKTLDILDESSGGFVVSKNMKTVNMLDLAKSIQDKIDIVGLRENEKLNETLISEEELPYTHVYENEYIILTPHQNPNLDTRLSKELSTQTAQKMIGEELRLLVEDIDVKEESS
jgi:UDP-N-acetylglucosamine 4,6-dehydratase|tara:strand:+ start:129 stop:1079 length:951 start_codon:yes stop_codon:yes gene_type:complete